MVNFHQKIIDNAVKFERMQKSLKELSDYWPEIYIDTIPNLLDEGKTVRLSTLQRYQHKGVWYVRHHLMTADCHESAVEATKMEYFHKMAAQIHMAQVTNTFIELDDPDECTISEKDRLLIKYPQLNPAG